MPALTSDETALLEATHAADAPAPKTATLDLGIACHDREVWPTVETAEEATAPARAQERPPSQSVELDDLVLTRIAASDAMFVTDERQRVRAWSDAAQNLLGYEADDVIGLYCYQVLTGRRPDGHPVCGQNCPVTRNARRGRGTAAYDVTAVAKDGSPRYVNNSVMVLEGSRGAFRVVHVVRESCDTPPTRSPVAPEPYCLDLLPAEQLTRRELEVLRLFARGSTLEQVASELSISVYTARNHATSIQHKMAVRNRLQMVLEGIRRGLV
jgi:PAS domain S-box-containing protein